MVPKRFALGWCDPALRQFGGYGRFDYDRLVATLAGLLTVGWVAKRRGCSPAKNKKASCKSNALVQGQTSFRHRSFGRPAVVQTTQFIDR